MTLEGAVPLTISADRRDGVVDLTLAGELEFGTAAPLRAALLEVSQAAPEAVVLDLRAVEFIDSTGLSLLVQAKQRFESENCRFAIRNPAPRVMRVLEIAGLAELFDIERHAG